MKKVKSILLFAGVILILTVCAVSFNVGSQPAIYTDFDVKSGVLYVSGEGELKNLFDFAYDENGNEADSDNHEAKCLCKVCARYKVEHIIIGEGITSVDQCFFGLSSVESVSLPKGLKEIKGGSFFDCYNLKSVYIPDSVTVIDNAFNGCTDLEWVHIPENAEVLCGFGYSKLTSLEIPRTVKKLAICSDTLERIFIPETVTAKMLKPTGNVNDYTEGDTGKTLFSGIHTKAKRLVVTGYNKSAAKSWAKEYGHSFEEISPVPEKLKVKNYNNYIKLTWNEVYKTETWTVYRKASGEKKWTKLATLSGDKTKYYDKSVKNQYGKTYTYRLKGDSNKIYVTAKISRIAAPDGLTVRAKSASKATLKWNKVEGAKYYYIYERYKKITDIYTGDYTYKYKRIAKVNAKNTSYTLTDIGKGTHYYCIKAYDGESYSRYSKAVEFNRG